MIITIEFSNKFFDQFIKENILNDKIYYNFLKRILDEEDYYLIIDKNYLNKLLHKFNNLQKNLTLEIIYRILKKPNLIDSRKNLNLPRDFKFITNNNETKINNIFDLEMIKKNSKEIFKKLNKVKSEIFDLDLKFSENSSKYKVNQSEIDNFNKKLIKSMIVSNTVIIYDQYIPSSLCYIRENKRENIFEFKEGKYLKDYFNTLKFLDNKIFSKTLNKSNCKIVTINKLQEYKHFQKFSVKFKNLAQNYLNNLKSTNGVMYIKDYDPDIWVDLHSRLLIFKDEAGQLVSYFIVEPGFDFMKLENINYYKKRKFRYRFTPGTKDNFHEKINHDLSKIMKQTGLEIRNTPIN